MKKEMKIILPVYKMVYAFAFLFIIQIFDSLSLVRSYHIL